VRLALPQPWQEVAHTADVGLAVEGDTPEEALTRLALALSALLAGGGPVEVIRHDRLAISGADRAQTAVNLLRELLYRFATQRLLPAACEVHDFAEGRAELTVESGRWDPQLHPEGTDVKAVTYHAARFEADGTVWRAQVLLDV
jgi:SHS2 domain-containing protein